MNNRPRVIDLFAGVGGLSLGAARAGFRVAAGVELDKRAIAAHKVNFPGSHHIEKDVEGLAQHPSLLLEAAQVKAGELEGLIGGPPCQGFSSIGHRVVDDPRNSLFASFFSLVAALRPAFFLAENVPGILDERNDTIRQQALSVVPSDYITLKPITVKANEYGAPTTRTRVFFIGYDPTRVSKLTEESFLPSADLRTVTVEEALRGLPELGSHWDAEDGWLQVSTHGTSAFGERAQGSIPEGVGDPIALERLTKDGLVSGFLPTAHTATTISRFSNLAHGKADKVSKSVRLNPKGYCPTLRAGTGPERGSYQAVRPVHPSAPRVICPREAARLQGFPDWFQFNNTKWHAFRQIGNSVSPIVAEAILSRIFKALKSDPTS